ncbi:RagB/SusD family nutrient uptake outer membrane protein, partial [Arcticibacter tournemirensis]
AYNMLVTLWGDVPLVKTPVTTPEINYTRQSVAEIDLLIEEDLNYAIANLPEVDQAANVSRINKNIVRQLAAEAYLRIGM